MHHRCPLLIDIGQPQKKTAYDPPWRRSPIRQAVLDIGVLVVAELAFRLGIRGQNRRLEEADCIGSQDSFGDRFKEGMLDQVQ